MTFLVYYENNVEDNNKLNVCILEMEEENNETNYIQRFPSNRTVISNTSIISSNLFPFTVSDHNKKDHYL